jgi:hypothetical protein
MAHAVRKQQIVPCSTYLVHRSQQPNIPSYTYQSLILAQPYISLMICHAFTIYARPLKIILLSQAIHGF